ncbi:MAG: glycoside hydrolase, partial [Saprospiraceae bacterium]
DQDHGMIISNRDAYFMKPGKSTINKLDDTTAQINVLAAGQIDPNLGMINQDGDAYFENFLAIKPHDGRFDAGSAMRFSLQHQNPLIAQKITGGSGYERNSFSLLTVSDPDVVVWALKPAEEGIDKGIIVRVWNVTNTDKAITIIAMSPIATAFSVTHIETGDQAVPLRDGKLATNIGHHKMQTFRLFLKNQQRGMSE